MAKQLTVKQLEALRTGRHSDGTGVGLMLWVSHTGGRTWVQRVTVHGKRHDIGLGGYPIVSLAEARAIATENKRAALKGLNPVKEKRKAKMNAAKQLTFAQAVERTCTELTPTWRGRKEASSFLSSLGTYANPHFGSDDIADITSAQIRQAVLACRAKVPNLSVKVQHRIHSVFKWAVANGLRDTNPATGEALALPKLEKKTNHNRALPYSEVANALVTIQASGAWVSTKLAFAFTVLTAARSGEVRGARWDEVDIDKAVWTIPPERMKMNREHRVPLSQQAVEILQQAQAQRDESGLIFPSVTGKELSDMTLSKLVREQGIKSTVHGFRSSFRTWCQEKTNVQAEVAEAALAHVKADKVEAAYARSDLFEKRTQLMESWANFLSNRPAEIVPLRVG
jgi:integrase